LERKAAARYDLRGHAGRGARPRHRAADPPRERRAALAPPPPRSGPGGREPAGRRRIESGRDRAVLAGFDAALLRGEPFREIIRIGPASERSFEINVVPLTDSAGTQVGAIGILFDVTRLTALENVRREFVADASHELRTPL